MKGNRLSSLLHPDATTQQQEVEFNQAQQIHSLNSMKNRRAQNNKGKFYLLKQCEDLWITLNSGARLVVVDEC